MQSLGSRAKIQTHQGHITKPRLFPSVVLMQNVSGIVLAGCHMSLNETQLRFKCRNLINIPGMERRDCSFLKTIMS